MVHEMGEVMEMLPKCYNLHVKGVYACLFVCVCPHRWNVYFCVDLYLYGGMYTYFCPSVSSWRKYIYLYVYLYRHGRNVCTFVSICIVTREMYTHLCLSVHHEMNVCTFVSVCVLTRGKYALLSLSVTSRKECTPIVSICIITRGMCTPLCLSISPQKECLHLCLYLYHHGRNIFIYTVFICIITKGMYTPLSLCVISLINLIRYARREIDTKVYTLETKLISKLESKIYLCLDVTMFIISFIDFTFLMIIFSSINDNQAKSEKRC